MAGAAQPAVGRVQPQLAALVGAHPGNRLQFGVGAMHEPVDGPEVEPECATVRQIVQTVRKGLSPGGIIVLHDNRSTTENALPKILAMIKDRGLTPVTVPELLSQDPPTSGQLWHHTCG